jgi:hypothetical protein
MDCHYAIRTVCFREYASFGIVDKCTVTSQYSGILGFCTLFMVQYSKFGIVGLNPTQDMDVYVCVYSVFVLLYM